MSQTREPLIIELENQLCAAMLASDTKVLGTLLSADLIFTNHLGQLLGKEEDLSAHRSGLLRIDRLLRSEQRILVRGSIAIVTVRTQITGVYAGYPANGDLRFTRVWAASSQNQWQVVAAHATAVS
ncbi:MAG: nuclear transport factor 2 family protein [Acidobacteriaceae bacterium]